MYSLKNKNQGFTIVELLIVIVVIGILAALVITTYGGIQAKGRNSQRQSDVQSLQTQIEAFYTQQSYYPSRADLNSASWRQTNMKSLEDGALQDPKSSSAQLAGAPAANVYSYIPLGDNGAACDTAGSTSCTNYTLTATYEGTVNGATTFVKKNLE